MSVKEIKALLEIEESLLATVEKLPFGQERNDAIQTIQKFAIEIASRMDRHPTGELGLKARVSKSLLLDPSPDVPDDTEINQIRWPTRILAVLTNAGIKTVGEIRETSDADILKFRRGGRQVVAFLRTALGRPT